MYAGVDIGGSKILVGMADSKLKILRSQKVATPESSAFGLHEIKRLISELSDGRRLSAIGVAAPGPIDFKRGRLLNPPNMGWRNVTIVEQLARAFRIPVVLEHDSNAGALAETTIGAAKLSKAVLYVTISTGVGTGLIINRQIYRGAYDSEGGHIITNPSGHICSCGGRGHFEAEVSGRAIKRRFGRFAFEITDRPTWDQIAHDIALGLATLSAVMSPEVIVLGGGVSVHWKRFRAPLKKHFTKLACPMYPPPKIVVAKHIETAALYGALILAKQAHLESRG
jgi:glucokinase